MTDEAINGLLWFAVGTAGVCIAGALIYLFCAAAKLGGPEDVPDCEHGIPGGSCMACSTADGRWREEM